MEKIKVVLNSKMTVQQFDNGYWYATEVREFARQIGVKSVARLRKDELEDLIRIFLGSGKIANAPREKLKATGTPDFEIGLSLSLRVRHYKNNSETKEFLLREAKRMDPEFKEKSGARYRLNRWREKQIESGSEICYRDLVRQFVELCQTSGKFPQARSGRYINFVANFLAGEINATREEAILAWAELKEMETPKTYLAWKALKNRRA